MLAQIQQIRTEAKKEITEAKDLLALENLERKYIGRSSQLRDLTLKLKDLNDEQKRETGQMLNDIRKEIEALILNRRNTFNDVGSKLHDNLDISLPGEKFSYGHLHPSTQLKNEVSDIFSSMGFEILEGPEVDNEYYNFETLNIPADHPARDMWDTFYLTNNKEPITSNKLLLRTHTSNMQVRVMEKRKPPLKVCVIGKCFRHEATNATHEHSLYQIEGFVIDEKISLANLIYTLKTFLTALYHKEVNVRVRPAYFPFVEPGLEVDMSCVYCGGKGCSICKGSGWIELLGAGMIHPKVFDYAGYPKNKYTGFAFGVGLDRLVMMKHRIDDIRRLHGGDLRFMRQF
jgi:phenylalanyl-tRNA synthetase alpha chain